MRAPAPYTRETVQLIRSRAKAGGSDAVIALELVWDAARVQRVAKAHSIELAVESEEQAKRTAAKNKPAASEPSPEVKGRVVKPKIQRQEERRLDIWRRKNFRKCGHPDFVGPRKPRRDRPKAFGRLPEKSGLPRVEKFVCSVSTPAMRAIIEAANRYQTRPIRLIGVTLDYLARNDHIAAIFADAEAETIA